MKTAPVATALAASLVATAALAYILPSFSILRKLVEGRDELHLSTLQVTGTASFLGSGAGDAGGALNVPGDHEIQSDLTFSVKLPGRCRADVKVAEGGQSGMVNSFGKRRAEGKEIAPLAAALGELCSTLAMRAASTDEARDALDRHLRQIGVDTRQTSLARFEGHIVYVLGNPAPGAAQFWIYKDSFLPARLMFADAQGTKWDLRMRDYGSPVAENWFPRIVEVAKGDELVMRFTALKADASAKLADNQF